MRTCIFTLLVAALCSSCDPGYTYTEEIVNNTAETLSVHLIDSLANPVTIDSSMQVLPNTRLEVTHDGGLGTASSILCGEGFIGYHVLIKAGNNKTVQKSATDFNNWTSTSDKSLGSSEKHCTFEINESDLQ